MILYTVMNKALLERPEGGTYVARYATRSEAERLAAHLNNESRETKGTLKYTVVQHHAPVRGTLIPEEILNESK